MNFVIAASLLQSALSQGCGNDVLVDDYSTTQNKIIDGADRIVNKLEGDYGTDGRTTFTISTADKTLTVIPANNTDMFFYAKYDERACFDLTNYYGFQFDLLAPEGATGSFTLTQKTADCSARVDRGDSIYLPLSKYYTTPGKKQTVVMPFADFTQLAIGPGQFDFKHLKDWTFVDPKPLGQPFVFSNMILLGGAPGCKGGNATAPTTSAGGPTITGAIGTSTNTGLTTSPVNFKNNVHRSSTTHLNLWLMLMALFA